MKNICIGVNIFKQNHRQDLCLESLYRLKETFNITLYNIQPITGDIYKDKRFPTLRLLTKKSGDIIADARNAELPLVYELFNILSKQPHDIFIFTNNDIIISDRYIKDLITNDYDCVPASRLSIDNIETLNDPITKYSHYQVAGFDTFAVKTNWWECNKNKFPQDYILGMPSWDVHYATLMMINGNSRLCNKWPPSIFHISHESPWMNNAIIPEKKYVEELFFTRNSNVARIWNLYLSQVLLKRTNNYHVPLYNESELEEKYFAI